MWEDCGGVQVWEDRERVCVRVCVCVCEGVCVCSGRRGVVGWGWGKGQ